MQDDQDRPSTETDATPKPPAGQNIKDLVTPGDRAEKEAAAEQSSDETSSADDVEDEGSISGRSDD